MTRRVTRDLVSGPLRCRVSSRARPVTLATTSTIGAACLGMAVLVTARLAHGGASARLVYARAPEASSCPDETALRSAVAARLGYDPFFPWAKQTVVVQVWRENRQYRARLQLVNEAGLAHGTRSLASGQPACAELFDAAALAISIAMDSLPKDEPPPARRRTPRTRARTTPRTRARTRTTLRTRARRTLRPPPRPSPPPRSRPRPPRPQARPGASISESTCSARAGVEPGPTVGGAVFAAFARARRRCPSRGASTRRPPRRAPRVPDG